MTDREKVIKGLECCIPYESEGNEHLCIYDDDYNPNCPYRGTGSYGVSCMTKLMRDALALLKAREPDETRLVRHYSRPNVYADLWLHCEKCGGRVDDRYKPKFCPECGRKVNWE